MGNFGSFIDETKQELKKVTWPTKRELWDSTIITIVTTFLMAAFIGAVDFVMSIIVRMFFG